MCLFIEGISGSFLTSIFVELFCLQSVFKSFTVHMFPKIVSETAKLLLYFFSLLIILCS